MTDFVDKAQAWDAVVKKGAGVKERLAELQYEAGMYQSLYENAVKVLREINRIVHVPTKRTKYSTPVEHYQADFDAIRKLTAFAITPAQSTPIEKTGESQS